MSEELAVSEVFDKTGAHARARSLDDAAGRLGARCGAPRRVRVPLRRAADAAAAALVLALRAPRHARSAAARAGRRAARARYQAPRLRVGGGVLRISGERVAARAVAAPSGRA